MRRNDWGDPPATAPTTTDEKERTHAAQRLGLTARDSTDHHR